MAAALEETAERLDEVVRSFDASTHEETRILLASLRPAEVANLLESYPRKVRLVLWELLEEDTRSQTLQYISEEVRADFLQEMDTAQLVAAADNLDTDDFADILQQLPQTISNQVLDALSANDRARVEAVLSYDEDSAGGLMNTDTITVRPRHALELVFRYHSILF